MVEFTEDDVGKQVVTANQDPLGEITEIKDGVAWVDPNERTLGEGELLFGWDESDIEDHDSTGTAPVPAQAIQLVSDDAVVLVEQLEVSFQQENVLPDADHEYAFYGSYGYLEDGEIHLINREFHVYTDEAYLGDGGQPMAEVIESHHVETDGEDRHTVDESSTEVVIDVDTDEPDRMEEADIEEFLGGWHVTHAERQ
jgi:hypothetical protein